jgi:hypothetical protein
MITIFAQRKAFKAQIRDAIIIAFEVFSLIFACYVAGEKISG